MEVLEGGQMVRLIEEREVVFDEFPVEHLAGVTGMLDELVDVTPVAGGARGVVACGLYFQSDEIFDVDDGYCAIGRERHAFGSLQHAESGRAKSMEQIDTTQRGLRGGVMRDVFRVERTLKSEGLED